MKTLVCTTPGLLEYKESAAPALSQHQAILKIKRIGICGTDLHAFEGTQPYFQYPRILGHEIAAELVDIDGDPKDFTKGELVTFIPYFNCGLCIACREGKPNCCAKLQVSGVHIDGGMVEYLSVPSHSLVRGSGLSPDALAVIEPLSIGAHAIRRANVRPGEFVLVIGAGPIGLGVMHFAKLAGARVIALDINEERLRFCKDNIQADHIIAAHSHGVDGQIFNITTGNMPTVVIDATGSLKAINSGFLYMAHGGCYILVGLQKGDISFSHPEFHKREATLMSSRNATRADFDAVIAAIKDGLIDPSAWITHRVSFDGVKTEFNGWLNPANRVIKAMVELF